MASDDKVPSNVNYTEGPELGVGTGRPVVIAKQLNSDYPVRTLRTTPHKDIGRQR